MELARFMSFSLSEATGSMTAEGPPGKAIVRKPVAAYIEKVYDEGDFSGLGVGT